MRKPWTIRALGLLMIGGVLSCALPRLPDPPAAPAPGPIDRAATEEWAALARLGASQRDCFHRHVADAIALNGERRPVYAAWSDGRSEEISARLIRTERNALPIARWVDGRARAFQEAGIPIVCAEFVSMEDTPPLPDAPLAIPSRAFDDDAVDADALRVALADAYGRTGFAGVAAEADRQLERLAVAPEYHCMTRHLIESIWRVAVMAPLHDRFAAQRDIDSPRELSETLLRLHLAALEEGARLDRAAAPLQARGIPILCRDVPPIRHRD